MDDSLGSDVHPAACGHLPIVGDAHFFGDFPVFLVVIFTDHQAIGDDDPGCLRFGMEQTQGMTGFHDQSLIRCDVFQVFLDQQVLHPVVAYTAGFTVGDQFVWIQGHFEVQVVVDHHLEGLAFGAFPFVFVNGFPVDPAFRTEPIAIDPAPGGQLFQEFRDQFFVVFFRDVPQSVLQSDFSLGRRQTEATIRSPANAFLKRFRFRQSVGELQFDGHGFSDIFIFHVEPLLFSKFLEETCFPF